MTFALSIASTRGPLRSNGSLPGRSTRSPRPRRGSDDVRMRKTDALLNRAFHATVQVGGSRHGQGVLVEGGFMLTAAHCIKWKGVGEIASPLEVAASRQTIKTRCGLRFHLGPLMADPVSDMAALGITDDQDQWKDYGVFEAWKGSVQAVPLSTQIPPESDVYVLSHTGKWIAGRAASYAPCEPRVIVSSWRQSIESAAGRPAVRSSMRPMGI